MKNLKKSLALLLVLVMLVGLAPKQLFTTVAAEESEPLYKVQIVSFIRGAVDRLRCSELLEARIYKSVDGGQTWEVATDVEGTPVSKLSYTWTNTSTNTPMVVFLTHDMTKVGVWGDTKEGTFMNGTSSTAVGGQWAACKTPGVTTTGTGTGIGSWPGTGSGGWPGIGSGGWPGTSWPSFGGNTGSGSNRPGSGSGNNSGSGSSSTTPQFSGEITVQVTLPNGQVISDSCNQFDYPSLEADLKTVALGLFIGESKTMLELLGESAIVHITCDYCSVSNIDLDDPNGVVELRNSTVTGKNMGEAGLSMVVGKQECTVHNGQSASLETKIFVFKKPKTSTTTTTLTLAADSLDPRCRYYINGVEGTRQTEDGPIVFTGLTPDTDYTVDVVAPYSNPDENITRYAYAYVQDTTKPVYNATVNTYLDGSKVDIEDIHGEDIILYLREENGGEYIYLPHVGTGTYSADVDNGVYYVYHKEDDNYHKINENSLVVANKSGSVNVHHYTATYDTAGGAFAGGETSVAEVYASGSKVTAISAAPTRAGYVFLGWSYGGSVIASGATVTDAIAAPARLVALWEKEINVSINITIDHTYTDANGNKVTDSNNNSKDDVTVSLVARDDANAPYLEVPNCSLTVSENSHSGHILFVNGDQTNSYATAGTTDIIGTRYKEDATPTFTGLSAGKEYMVTVSKADYTASVTATKQTNGDWVIDVNLKFDPRSEEITFEVKMDEDVPEELYPEAAIVKVLYYNAETGKWEIIAQHADGNPGVRVPIAGKTGNVGSFPVWVYESSETTPYYYRMMVSAFVYKDGTIVPTEESQALVEYTDKNFIATVGNVPGGKQLGNVNGAYFNGGTQKGILDATITLEAYDVTFQTEGGKIQGADAFVVRDQYYVPSLNQYVPTMNGHNFLGWFYKDADGNYTEKATAGELLNGNITLYALWDQTLEGKITVSGTYEKNGQTMTVWSADRATQAMVILQQITSDTVNNLKVVNAPINWNGDVGTSDDYKFDGLDPMKSYRIEVIITNYETAYQNSTTPTDAYEADDYRAVYTQTQPWETFVNAMLSFEPESYIQSVEVDASQIGEGFRPGSVETEIWYTERGSGDPEQVITQHADGGLVVQIGTDGKQIGTYVEEVWKEKWNGNLYDYQAHVVDRAVLDMPVSIDYGHHSNFDTLTGQARNPLSVTLVPNRYHVTFDLKTGSEEDKITYYGAHVWSHATSVDFTPTREGYVFTGWKATKDGVYADGKILASVHESVTLEAQWEKATLSYKVEYYLNGQLDHTDTLYARFEDVVDPVFQQMITVDGENYALDYVVGAPLTIGVDLSANVIKVYYGTDSISDADDSTNTPDGIPDYYQATITFEIVNGTWDDTHDKAAKVRVYTLYTQNPDRPWSEAAAPEVGALPEGTADTSAGYEDIEDTWSPDVPQYVERSATYTLAYNLRLQYSITVIVENGTVTQAGQNETYTTHIYTVTHDGSLALTFAPEAGFVLDYIVVDGTMSNGINLAGWNSQNFDVVRENHTIYVVYSADTVGGGEDGDEPDSIPDKYQKMVTFKVVNGTWDGTGSADKVYYLTLMKNNKWAENGSAELPTVPTGMAPNANFKKGAWNVDEFPETVSGTEPVTYTHTFKPTVYMDYVYTVEHYKQQTIGIFTLAEREEITISGIELNADENDFQNAVAAVTANAKNYGSHYREVDHADRVAQGTPVFGQSLKLKLYYALDSHTVKYDLNGGSAGNINYSDAAYICGTAVKAKEAAHKHGYVFQGWKAEDGTIYQVNEEITVDQDIILTAQWAKQTGLSYTVYHMEENTNKVLKQEEVVGNMTFGDVVNSLSHVADIADYLFASASPESLTIDVDAANNIINLYYTLDTVGGGEDGEESDEVPDKYQKKITFKVANGMWNDGTATDKVVYVTLKTGDRMDENGSASLTAPAVGEKPDANFKAGAWDVTPPQTVSGKDAAEFVYTYFRSTTPVVPSKDVLYIVEHYKAENGSYPTDPTEVDHLTGQIGATVSAVAKNYAGYCVNLQAAGTVSSAVLKEVKAEGDIVILKLYYDADIIGGGNEGEEADEVPDKFQKKVIFKVVNGTWGDGSKEDLVHILDLMTNGKWDINGTATLEIATGMIANAGYSNGSWDVTPSDVFSGVEEEVYTFTFEKTPEAPKTGDNTHMLLWSMLLLISGLGMVALVLPERKRRRAVK